MEGIVNSYSEEKGFGFIEQKDGRVASFHRSAIEGAGYKTLTGGDRVRFDVEETLRGLEAKNVRKAPSDEQQKN